MPPAAAPSPAFRPAIIGGAVVSSLAGIIAVGLTALIGAGPAGAQSPAETPTRFDLPFLEQKTVTQADYIGDAACSSCHQEKAGTYHRTAHARTSSLPSGDSIHGHFSAGSNILRTVNPNLYFQMEAKENAFTQTAVVRTSATEVLTRTEQIDIVVGSGRKGQTYLFWDEDQLFQLPVSYWTGVDDWVNSPGYIDGNADFGRPIVPRCLECHASRFAAQTPTGNRYIKTSLVLGISCEKCHGPGGEHVARYRSASPPRSPAESAIVNPARLSRDRQIDVCALCHAGSGKPLQPALSYEPGDDLARFVALSNLDPGAQLDVHASQVQLLRKSRCYQSSATLTCLTCHDVHAPQRDAGAFASRCLTCHQTESCRAFPKLGHAIDGKCVDCHMPLQQTKKIISSLNGRRVQPEVRNHQIAIYPDVTLP